MGYWAMKSAVQSASSTASSLEMAVEKKYTPSLTPFFSASCRLYRALESGEISPSAIPRIPTRTMAKSTPDAAASAQRMVP